MLPHPPMSSWPSQPRSGRSGQTPEDAAHELDLARRAKAGDQEALSDLLARYQDRLFAVCFRMVHHRELAADLTQDALIKVIQHIDTYDGRSKLSTWVIRITMNVCLSRLRAEKLRKHASLEAHTKATSKDGSTMGVGGGHQLRLAGGAHAKEPDVDVGVEQNEQQRLLARALDRVSPEQRAILILRDARGLDYEQISEVMGIPGGTVKSRIFRARAALRQAIEGLGALPPGGMMRYGLDDSVGADEDQELRR